MPSIRPASRWEKWKSILSNQWDTASQFPPIKAVTRLGELTDEGLMGRLRNQEDIDQLNDLLGSGLTTEDMKIGVMVDKPGRSKLPRGAKKAARELVSKINKVPERKLLTTGPRFVASEEGIVDKLAKPYMEGEVLSQGPKLGNLDLKGLPGRNVRQLPKGNTSFIAPEYGPARDMSREIPDLISSVNIPRTSAINKGRLIPDQTVRYKSPIPADPNALVLNRRPKVSINEPIISKPRLKVNPEDIPVDTTSLSGKQTPSLGFKPIVGNPKAGTPVDSVTNGIRSITNKFRADSPAGSMVADTLTKARVAHEAYAGQLEQAIEDIAKPFSKNKELWAEFQSALDKGTPVRPELQSAVDKARALDSKATARATASGMGYRDPTGTKLNPFQGRENYWPHLYTDDFLKDEVNIANMIAKKRNIPLDKAVRIVQRAKTTGGKLITEGERVGIDQAAKFGERYKGFQKARELDLPGYRTDIGAMKAHYRDLAKRTVEAEMFGPMDIADELSPLSKLKNATSNPNETARLLRRVLDREGVNSSTGDNKLMAGVMKAETARHLSQFPISNVQQAAAIPLRAGIRNTAKALGKRIFDKEGTVARSTKSGARASVDSDIIATSGRSLFDKAYGIKASEGFMRDWASEAGRLKADDLFRKLKKDPTNTKLRGQIERLTMTPADELITQEGLTPTQSDWSGGRMSEMTQGRAQSQDLPYHWTGASWKNPLFLYKKYGYRQAQTIADAIKENPAKNIPLAALGFTAMGEATGDVKAGIKGAVKGAVNTKLSDLGKLSGNMKKSIAEEFYNRGSYSGIKNPIARRVMDDVMQSWLLGLPGDVISTAATGSKERLYNMISPVISDIINDVSAGSKAIQGKPDALKKTVLRAVPFIGSGLAAGEVKDKGRGKSRFSSSK